MSKTGFIYKLTNTVDDEFYVGSTTTDIEQRLKNHKNHYNNDVFYNTFIFICPLY